MNHGLDAFYKKAALKVLQNSLENTNDRVSILTKLQASTCNFIEIVTLAMVFSSEICELFKNISLQNTFGGCFRRVKRSQNSLYTFRFYQLMITITVMKSLASIFN